ncbi:MAG: transposase [Phycisphaerales bacterium]|nr:transposase [Phycisphaerales bacterium]
MNQWPALIVHASDARLSINDNVSERALRRVAVGRKDWMFSGHVEYAQTHAVLWSLYRPWDISCNGRKFSNAPVNTGNFAFSSFSIFPVLPRLPPRHDHLNQVDQGKCGHHITFNPAKTRSMF